MCAERDANQIRQPLMKYGEVFGRPDPYGISWLYLLLRKELYASLTRCHRWREDCFEYIYQDKP